MPLKQMSFCLKNPCTLKEMVQFVHEVHPVFAVILSTFAHMLCGSNDDNIHDTPVAAPRSGPSASSSVPPPPRLHGDGSRTNPARRAGPTPRRGRAPFVENGGGGPLQ